VDNRYRTSLSISFALHFLLLLFLLVGDFTTTPKATPDAAPMQPIQAVLVDKAKVFENINKQKKKKADAAKKIKELAQQKAAAKIKKAKEEQRRKDLDRQRKKKAKTDAANKARNKKAAEKKKAEEKAAADNKAKRLKDEAAAKKAEDNRKKKAAERKRKVQEAKEQALLQEMLEQQMAEEMASRQQARRQQVMTEAQRFNALIKRTIQSQLIRDRSTMEGKSCKLTISLAPSGFVTNVVVGSGDKNVCDAAEKAIYKAGTLPVSKDPEVFKEMKRISLMVIPEF
jgi:colicin import membrane protein